MLWLGVTALAMGGLHVRVLGSNDDEGTVGKIAVSVVGVAGITIAAGCHVRTRRSVRLRTLRTAAVSDG
jgi:hypothetical protein